MNEQFLTVGEVASLLRVSRERTYQLIVEAGIPAVRISPRRIRVPRAALERWLQAKMTGAVAVEERSGGHGE